MRGKRKNISRAGGGRELDLPDVGDADGGQQRFGRSGLEGGKIATDYIEVRLFLGGHPNWPSESPEID